MLLELLNPGEIMETQGRFFQENGNRKIAQISEIFGSCGQHHEKGFGRRVDTGRELSLRRLWRR